LKRVSASVIGLLLANSASAVSFTTLVDVNQSLAVTPVDSTQVTEHTGSIDFNSLISDVSFTSGQYIVTSAEIDFLFQQEEYIANTPDDIAFSHNTTRVSSAGSLSTPFEYNGSSYNYMVNFRSTDYYQAQREDASATVDLTGGLFSRSGSTDFRDDYIWTPDVVSYNVPDGTTGLLERTYSSDTTITNTTLGGIYFGMYGSLPLYLDESGSLNYSATATNEYLDLLGISIDLTYEENPNFIPPKVAPVPVPVAVWLFLSGMMGLVGVARRKE